ncbi:MAG: methylated-DNA--[protein]-cysteine S-methyltransferase [Myxococcota bacterium]|nr:methylated-DNA--[protein]-cysteine S-methyltransferase [Myxococcota bacterium]
MQRAFPFQTRFGTGWLHYEGEHLLSTSLPELKGTPPTPPTVDYPTTFQAYHDALLHYFDHGRPLACPAGFFEQGSRFRATVYRIVTDIPWGQTLSYGEVAAAAGSPGAARAVGSAMAANRFAPFIPCHRVVPSNGGLGEYGGGVALKKALLEMEAGSRRLR